MKTIHIQAKKFFDILKINDTSMWSVFAEMIDGEEKEIIFINDENKMLFTYKLPKTIEELNKDQAIFAEEYTKKIKENN